MEGILTSKLSSLFQPCASLVLAALVSCCVMHSIVQYYPRGVGRMAVVSGTLRHSKNEEGKEGEMGGERVCRLCKWWKWRRRERATARDGA